MKNNSLGPIDRIAMVVMFVARVCSSMLKKLFTNSQPRFVKCWTGARLRHGKVSRTYPLGYMKPLGKAKKIKNQMDPNAEPIIREVFRHVGNGMSCSEIADLLNKKR